MPASLRRCSLKLVATFFLSFACLLAQDPTSDMTPSVARVGDHLACRCGVCRNTVATCPMLHCEYSGPMRARIKRMQDQGINDQNIIKTVVKEQGIVALAAPPASGWGLFTWVMPGVALLLGFLVYSWWVRRNRPDPEPVSDADDALLERFRGQIENEMGESDTAGSNPNQKK